MAEVCNATPCLWANICVQIRNERNWSRKEVSPTIAHIDRQLVSSKTRRLRIAFALPVSTAPTDLGRHILQRLLAHNSRFECVFFAGRPSCGPQSLCLHAVLTEFDFIRTTPSLTSVYIVQSDANTCCEVTHKPLRVDPTRIERFRCCFPITLPPTPLDKPLNPPLITHLDIDFQSSPIWANILRMCGALHCLIYRAHNTLFGPSPIIPAVPSLRELHVFSLLCLPPLTAPNLRELNVADPNIGFTYDRLTQILDQMSPLPCALSIYSGTPF